MDAHETMREIGRLAPLGDFDEVNRLSNELRESSDDPFVLLQCVSLLKVFRQKESMDAMVGKITSLVGDDRNRRIEIAGALKGLEYPSEALAIVRTLEQNDSTHRLAAMCLVDMEEFEDALAECSRIADPATVDRILLSGIYSGLGEHPAAIAEASRLAADVPGNYDVMVAYVTAHILGGKDKEAIRYARQCLKSKDADGNAIAAYTMRVMGNHKSAAGYATRALNLDPKHIGAMETLGICLAEKGEFDKARIVAGAINEVSPGHRSSMEILRYCERSDLRAFTILALFFER